MSQTLEIFAPFRAGKPFLPGQEFVAGIASVQVVARQWGKVFFNLGTDTAISDDRVKSCWSDIRGSGGKIGPEREFPDSLLDSLDCLWKGLSIGVTVSNSSCNRSTRLLGYISPQLFVWDARNFLRQLGKLLVSFKLKNVRECPRCGFNQKMSCRLLVGVGYPDVFWADFPPQ